MPSTEKGVESWFSERVLNFGTDHCGAGGNAAADERSGRFAGFLAPHSLILRSRRRRDRPRAVTLATHHLAPASQGSRRAAACARLSASERSSRARRRPPAAAGDGRTFICTLADAQRRPPAARARCALTPPPPAPPAPAPRSAPAPAAAPAPAPAPRAAPAPAPAPRAAAAPAPQPPAATKVTYAADAFFDFNKAVIKAEGKAKLDDLVGKVKGVNLEVIIAVGHTDAVGADAYNQALSVKRAESVKAYLVSKGIEKNRVYTEGKGEKQPVADNKTAEGRAKNRRVEIEVVGTRPNR